jgi:hypothetical protein
LRNYEKRQRRQKMQGIEHANLAGENVLRRPDRSESMMRKIPSENARRDSRIKRRYPTNKRPASPLVSGVQKQSL